MPTTKLTLPDLHTSASVGPEPPIPGIGESSSEWVETHGKVAFGSSYDCRSGFAGDGCEYQDVRFSRGHVVSYGDYLSQGPSLAFVERAVLGGQFPPDASDVRVRAASPEVIEITGMSKTLDEALGSPVELVARIPATRADVRRDAGSVGYVALSLQPEAG